MISDQDVDYDGNDDSEEYDYPVLSYDNIDGDDDSDACDYLVISDATMFFSPSTRLSRSLVVIQWGQKHERNLWRFKIKTYI